MSDYPAVKETPQQETARREMERVRLEQGRDLAARKKIPEPVATFSDPFIFRFKQFENTQFAGLWRLEILNKYGKVEEVVTDADALPHVLEAIGNIFANRGY